MDLKERIVEKSMSMFLQRGCKSVTMDDIATENGISKRTLYEVFSDKSSLLEAAIIYTSEKMKCSTEKLMEGVTNVLDLIFKIHEQQAEIIINLRINFFFELKKFYPEIYSRIVSRFTDYHMDNTTALLLRGQQEGFILKDIDNTIVSKVIFQISGIIGDKEIFSLENISRKQLFKETMLYYIRGICTEKGIQTIDEYFKK